MKKHNIILISLLCLVALGCADKKQKENEAFSFNPQQLKSKYTPHEPFRVSLDNLKNKAIDSVVYFLNQQKVASYQKLSPFNYDLTKLKLGKQYLEALVYSDGDSYPARTSFEVISDIKPQLLQFTILNTYPHDIQSFTEGLEFHKDTLYESTGEKGGSYVRKYNYKTAKVYQQVSLPSQYFGEGISVVGNQLFQLSWQEKTGFIYNVNTLKLEKTFTYNRNFEGWGLTNDGNYLYQSDGTEKIWKIDPKNQKVVDSLIVYSTDMAIQNINELELVNGYFYANIWQKDAVAKINASTGAVEAIIDFSSLRKKVKNTQAEVLNGIAYNPKSKSFFVTGKNWDSLFEIKIQE